MRKVCFALAGALMGLSLNLQASVGLSDFEVGDFAAPPISVPGRLFQQVGPPSAGVEPGAVTVWPVTIDLQALATLPPNLLVQFADRQAVTLQRGRAEMRGPQAYRWSGSGADCSGAFTVSNGGITGTLSCLTGNYGIETNAGGQHLTRYDSALMPPNDGPDPLAPLDPSELPAPSEPLTQPASAPLAPTRTPDQEVDILVLYTGNVRARLDGPGGRANTYRFMQHLVDQAQLAFDTSLTSVQLRMVHTQQVTFPNSDDVFAGRDYLQFNPEPLALRNAWAADIVMLAVDGLHTTVCGTSFEPGYGDSPPLGLAFAPRALGVAAQQCSFANFTFTHELGHVFGANHNRENVPTPFPGTPVQPWAFGLWHDNRDKGGARTVMSYPIDPSLCTPPCSDYLVFSNAAVTIGWFHTGQADVSENARVITYSAPTTAQYRLSLGRIFADGFEP